MAPARRSAGRLKIAAYDFGMKWNILRRLSAHGCDVRVYPAIDARRGSSGGETRRRVSQQWPWRPGAADVCHREHAKLVEADVPMFGICLGHQILGLAMGGTPSS